MLSFRAAFLTDFVIIILCACALVWRGQLSALHPATTYLFYHAWAITLRLAVLVSGFQVGLTAVMRNPPTQEEIIRAAVTYDVALVAVTLVWLHLARRGFERVSIKRPSVSPGSINRLSLTHLRGVAAFSIVVGLVSLWYLRFAGADAVAQHIVDLGDWSNSAWVYMTATWALQGFAMLHYYQGFPPILTALTGMVFLFTVLGNTARYALVVWFVFCVFTYLSIRHKRWPNLCIIALAIMIAVAWYPLKTIVQSYWAGDDPMTILNKAAMYTETSLSPRGASGDILLLDSSALHMALVDRHGSFFHGSTLLPLLTLPVPRPWWPSKPSVADWARITSTPDRPVAEFGLVPGIVGEGYVNFGYLGAVAFPIVAAYLYGTGYFCAIRYPHLSIQRFAYIICACMLIQVYRDGLVSALTFTLVSAMPMTLVLYMHWFFPSRIRPRRFMKVVSDGGRVSCANS